MKSLIVNTNPQNNWLGLGAGEWSVTQVIHKLL